MTDRFVLSLDVGTKRVGVAGTDLVACLPRPIGTIINDEKVFDTIAELARKEGALRIVVGLPRGLDGQETGQTEYTKKFAAELKSKTGLDVVFQDEALTSILAEEASRAKKSGKKDVDSLAAAYILDDYLADYRSNNK